ncbi:mechanosensitive ion channel family protein, partial [Halobium palmae]
MQSGTAAPNGTGNGSLGVAQQRPDDLSFLHGFSFVEQVLLTLVVVAAVVGIRYLSRRWHSTHDHDGWQHLTVSGTVAVVTAVAIFLLVDLWDQVWELGQALQNFGGQETAGTVLIAGVVLGATYALTSFVGRAIQITATSAGGISDHQREVLYRLSQIFLYSVGILVVISLFTNLGSLLVGAGFLGIIVGMAARQTLGAVLAGFVLMFSRPFEIGDWVEFDEVEGVVTDIGIVNTRVQTFDGEIVNIPNDQVSANTIVNRTRKGRYRIEVEVGADYDDDPRDAAEVALDSVGELDEVLDVPSPQVVTKRFGDSAVVFGVRCWIDNPSKRRMWRARTAMIEAIYESFQAHGVKIPFPQRELMARNEAGGFRLRREGSRRDAPTGEDATGEE